MNHFHVCKKMKSIFLMILSVVILVCSVSSFSIRSQAAEAYLASYAIESYMSLVTYLLSRGYSAPKIDTDSTVDISKYRYNNATVQNLLNSLEVELNTYQVDLGYRFMNAITQGAQTGKFHIDDATDQAVRDYFDSITVNNSMNMGAYDITYNSIAPQTIISTSYDLFYNNNYYTDSYTLITNCEYLLVYNLHEQSDGTVELQTYLFPREYQDTQNWAAISRAVSITYPVLGFSSNYGNLGYYGVVTSNIAMPRVGLEFTAVSGSPNTLFLTNATSAILTSIFAFFRANGYYNAQGAYEASKVTDLSNQDILSTASTIDAVTGDVSGGITIYLPNGSTLEEILEDYANGVISYTTALAELGLSTVASDATVAQKQSALADVLVPDSTYDWNTRTMWGEDILNQTITKSVSEVDSQENTKTGAIARLFTRYGGGEQPDPDEQDKANQAMLLGTIALWLSTWEWPSMDPDDPAAGGTDPDNDPGAAARTADVIAGVGVASSLIGDLFDAAGGSSGYGMIFTVGMSFVLFSVIIGAGHFLGSHGNNSEIQAKNSASPDKPAKSGQAVAKASQQRNIKVKQKKGA